MADIKDQLIKDSYNYVLQSDLSTGVVYRIGGDVPVSPIFQSGLTINGDFNYSNGTEQPGYVLTTNGSGYSYWNAVSGSSGISGSGTSNYLPKWSGSTSLVDSLVYDSSTGVTIGTGFTWDNTNGRLGIGTNSPVGELEVTNSELVGVGQTSSSVIINASQTAGGGIGGAVKYGLQIIGSGAFNRNIGTAVYGLNIPPYSGSVYGGFNMGAHIQDRVGLGTYNPIDQNVSSLLTVGNSVNYSTYNNNPNSIYLRLNSNTNDITAGIYASQAPTNIQAGIFFTRGLGNGVGVIDFITANANVNGSLNARMFGSGNLVLQNGGTFTDAGYKLDVNGTSRVTSIMAGTQTSISSGVKVESDTNIRAWNQLQLGQFGITNLSQTTLTYTASGADGYLFRNSQTHTAIAGTYYAIRLQNNIAPPSGRAVFNLFEIISTINQTGGANGITRGLYVNPTISAATDFRAIETTVGNVILNSVSGNTLIGTSTNTGYKLEVFGTGTTAGISSNVGLNIQPVAAPIVTSLTYTLQSGSSLGVGTYYYRVTYYNAIGETSASNTIPVITLSGSQVVQLNNIPISTNTTVIGRKIYRDKLGDGSAYGALVGTISNNTGTTYTDSLPDSDPVFSGSFSSRAIYAKANTTVNYISVSGTRAMIADPSLTTFGVSAGAAITVAPAVTLFGAGAGQRITFGAGNTLFGFSAGASIIGGSQNVAMGEGALSSGVVSGSYNIGLGPYVLNREGSFNIAMGYYTANSLTGSRNVLIGSYIGSSTSSYNDAIIIGHNATPLSATSFQINIGNTIYGRTNTGNVMIGTTTDAGYKLDVNGTSRFSGFIYSDAYATSVQRIQFNNGNVASNIGYIRGVSDGVIRLLNASENDFTRLQFGGGTTSFPSLQRSGSALSIMDASGTASSNLLIGKTTDSGQKLQVSGNTLLQGSLTATTKTTIGSEGDISCALLQMASTTQGVLFPRMTNTQRTSISSPVAGLMVYCTDSPEGLFIYKSTGWVQII